MRCRQKIPIYILQARAQTNITIRPSSPPTSPFPFGYTFAQVMSSEEFQQFAEQVDTFPIRFIGIQNTSQSIILVNIDETPLPTPILFTVEDLDIGGGYDPITSTFQAPVDGIYSVGFIVGAIIPMGTVATFSAGIQNITTGNILEIRGGQLIGDPIGEDLLVFGGGARLFIKAGQRIRVVVYGIAFSGNIAIPVTITSGTFAGGVSSLTPV